VNCARIQKVLEDEPRFAATVARRDQRVTIKGVEHSYAALTVAVGQALQQAGVDDTKCPREFILVFAMKSAEGTLPPPLPEGTKPPVAITPRAVVKARPVKPKPEAVPADAPKPPEPVTVVCAQSPSAPPRAQSVAQEKMNQFIASGDMLRFQCCVASGQLLAALYQLAEQDTQPGHEERKALITALVDKYEEMAKTYINFSVKQIIRDRLEEQIKG